MVATDVERSQVDLPQLVGMSPAKSLPLLLLLSLFFFELLLAFKGISILKSHCFFFRYHSQGRFPGTFHLFICPGFF